MENWGFEDIHELTGPIASIRNDSPYTDYLKEKGLLDTHRNYMIEYTSAWSTGEAKPWEEPPCPLPAEDHMDAYTGRIAEEWIRQYGGGALTASALAAYCSKKSFVFRMTPCMPKRPCSVLIARVC